MNKVIILIIFYFGIALVTSCLNCPDVNAYYDFSSLDAEYPNGTSISVSQDFILILSESEISFVTDNRKFNFDLLSSAWATEECPEQGHLGKKFKIDEIIITSDSDWDEFHSAGTALNDIIQFGSTIDGSNIQYDQFLNDVNDFGEFNFGYYFKFNVPTQDTEHIFNIQVMKSNGVSVGLTTNLISWTN